MSNPSTERAVERPPADGGAERPPVAGKALVTVAALVAVALAATAGRDGFHRDELYFLACARHLAWGYVDQPPLSVGLVRLARDLFGSSAAALRVFPAIAAVAIAVVTGLVARELGGRWFAQTIAAVAAGFGVVLAAAHLAGPTIYDFLAWTIVTLLVVRLVRGASRLSWLAVGAVIGVALLNKETVLLLVVGLLVGLTVDRRLPLLRTWYVVGGTLIAVAIAAPMLWWQARHSFPSLEMSSKLRQEHSGLGASLGFLPIQLLLPGWWAAPVWLGGLVALLREPRLRPLRFFAWGYLVLFVWNMVTIGDRPYYVAGLYPMLLAAGGVVAEGVVAGRRRFLATGAPRRRLLWRSPVAALLLAAVGVATELPALLPVLPARALATVPLQELNYNLGETVGWPELVRTVAAVRDSLPAGERRRTVVLTSNYGEAGAIEQYGGRYDLGTPYSGHNSYSWWGPPPEVDGPVIAVGYRPEWLAAYFSDVRVAARIDNLDRVDNDERGQPVLVCRGRLLSWARLWPRLRHYG